MIRSTACASASVVTRHKVSTAPAHRRQPVHKSNVTALLNHDCTPSTRRPLDGVAVPHPIHGLICAQAPTDEDSIPWKQALELIEAKKVKSVEFNDVAMDKCWVVTSDGRFRVGEGYP